MVLHNQEKDIEELLYSYVAAFLLQCRWFIERAISIILSVVGYGSVLGICHISEARDRDNKVWDEEYYRMSGRGQEIWGSGQGSELLRYALGKLKKNGFRNICLWVMKGNIRARKFYEKNGFQISGKEREIEIAECRVSEVEYIYYG